MSREQANALTAAQAEAMSQRIKAKDLATKGDLIELEQRLIKCFAGIAISQAAVILAVMALLHNEESAAGERTSPPERQAASEFENFGLPQGVVMRILRV